MAAGIFISYRRDESRHAAGRLADDLAQAFGPGAIFRDIEGIDPGVDFTRSLDRALGSCVVMLVLIGPEWLDMRDAHGQRRLENPQDWIRLEIATALARDIRVVPVLLEGAAMPQSEALSPDLEPLTRRQALDMSDSRWRGDLQRLVEALEKIPGLSRGARAAPAVDPGQAPPARGGRKPLALGIGLGVLGLLIAAALLEEFGSNESFIPTEPSSQPFVSAPVPDLARAAVGLDLSGMWRTNTGEVYHFEQNGRQVRFVAQAGGQQLGQGHGEFDGALLRVALTMRMQGGALGSANCDLQPAPDGRSFSGLCMGPNGAFPAQIFR